MEICKAPTLQLNFQESSMLPSIYTKTVIKLFLKEENI